MLEVIGPDLPPGVPAHVVYNGILEIPPLRAWLYGRKRLKVGYLGNLGSQYDFSALLELAARNEHRVEVEIRGAGRQETRIRTEIKERRLRNVKLEPPVQPARLDEVMSDWDATLVPLCSDPVFECYLPAKMFDSLGRGIPVFVSGKGDSADFVTKSGGGVAIPPGDIPALEKVLFQGSDPVRRLESMGLRGRAFVSDNMLRRVQAQKLLDILQQAAERFRQGRPGREAD